MSMLVDVLHPAPMEATPRRGTLPRRGLVAMRTPAEIRTVSAAEAPEAGRFAPPAGNRSVTERVIVRKHGGRRWIPIHDPVGDRIDRMPGLVGEGDLKAYLRGEIAGTPANMVLACFMSATPVSDRYSPVADVPGADRTRGIPEGELRLGKVVIDGRDGAPARLRAHLDSELLVIGGIAHARLRPTLLFSPRTPARLDIALTRRPEGTHRRYDPADVRAAFADWPSDPGAGACEAALEAGRAAGEPDGANALLANLNAMPGPLAAALAALAGADRAETGAARDRTAALQAACASLDLRGRVGGIALHDAQGAIRILSDAADHLSRHDMVPGRLGTVLSASRYLASFALPRVLDLTAPSPDDAEALAHLAP